VNTFSPEGRLFQVEYAVEAIKLGTTAIGIQTADGVVLVAEKRVSSPLLEPASIQKIVKLDAHIGCAISGMVADARTLVDHARVETQHHWFMYDERMGVESTVQSVCDLSLQFGDGEIARPFGVALLIAGVDEKGPSLWHVDPSGAFTRFSAKAIGAGSEGAQNTLQEQYNKSLKLPEAQKMAMEILRQVMEEKISTKNVEMATVTVARPEFRFATEEELLDVIKRLDAAPI
jgi:20S proteasome subunit alpha 5